MPAIPEESWWAPVAELVAREGVSIREAATRLRVPVTNEQAANTFRLKGFQRILRAERNRFYGEVAADPAWSRRCAVGKMLVLVDRLMDKGEDDKALEGLLKVARVEGWLSGETNVNVFAGLSDKELSEIKSKIAQRADGAGSSPASIPSNN